MENKTHESVKVSEGRGEGEGKGLQCVATNTTRGAGGSMGHVKGTTMRAAGNGKSYYPSHHLFTHT